MRGSTQTMGNRSEITGGIYNAHMKLKSDCPNLPCWSLVSKAIYESLHNGAGKLTSLEPDTNAKDRVNLGVNQENHLELFTDLLNADYAHSEMSLRRFDLKNFDIKQGYNRLGRQMNYIRPPGMANGDLKIARGDLVIVEQTTDVFTCGIIKDIEGNIVWFLQDPLLLPSTYRSVRFATSGSVLWSLRNAISTFASNKSHNIFKPNDQRRPSGVILDLESTSTEFLSNRLEGNKNERQRKAIEQILEGNCRPRPYMLFGPPGTGKTKTLVELIIQIFYRNKGLKILVTASANTCVDKLAEDLHATGKIDQMIRLSSKANIDKLKTFNKKIPEYYAEALSDEVQFRIIITTNMMAGRLKTPPFDYVIVDEAGHASEPETLIPMNKCARDGCVVLAGDPEQLGPVVGCERANLLGLGRSLMVRLRQDVEEYKMKDWAKDSTESEYGDKNSNKKVHFDKRYITRLNICYRSDERVMRVSNKLFYQNDLKCLNRTPPSLLKLSNFENPISFIDAVGAKEDQFERSTSRYNEHEARTCAKQVLKFYKLGIEPRQIGVITPYKSQKVKIQEILTNLIGENRSDLNRLFRLSERYKRDELDEDKDMHLNELSVDKNLTWMCKIDTVDGFQGEEREIILVSLVRSTPYLSVPGHRARAMMSFVDDPRRFNVTVSRAKWMTIVIGCEILVQHTENWSEFLRQTRAQEDIYGFSMIAKQLNELKLAESLYD